MAFYLIRVLYFLLPVAIANMMPVFVRTKFKRLAYPLDLHQKIFGKRILGEHKTIRGLLFGVLGAIIISYLQFYLYMIPFFKNLSFVPYGQINPLNYGVLVGLGVIIGDAFGSFVKRMRGIAPGDSYIPLDQIVAPIGAMLFIIPYYKVTFGIFLTSIIISFFAHIIIKYIGYTLKIDRRKW